MSRVARVVVLGFAHHVTKRGNPCADVCYSDDDRRAYLRFLRRYTERYGLAMWAQAASTQRRYGERRRAVDMNLIRGLNSLNSL